jgi:L-Ala-D/L-Glu epimerase
MSLRIRLCPFRLQFKHPFGTAHGVRTGTDCVFVRLEQNGIFGYGEATMPPYVSEDQGSVIAALNSLDLSGVQLPEGLDELIGRSSKLIHRAPCARAALVTAAYDLTGQLLGRPIWELLEQPEPSEAKAMFTLGICELRDIPQRLSELSACEVLKVKLDAVKDLERIAIIKHLWTSGLFLDVNQAWTTEAQATDVLSIINRGQLLGIEQPFAKDDLELNRWLERTRLATVYADESVQGLADMPERSKGFGGVNLKLMKCGGLDQALAMARTAAGDGQRVMLGSMSESSLGCTAAFHLAGSAELLDLDGPWLITNDPFTGIQVKSGGLSLERSAGVGVELVSPLSFV